MDYEKAPYFSASYVNGQQIVWHKTYGKVALRDSIVANDQTIASICSTTKVITATAIMKLVDEGKLTLEHRITDLLPQLSIKDKFNHFKDITVRTLLTHSSGMPRDTKHAYWSGPNHDFPNQQELYQSLAELELTFPIDEKVSYSNIGYALLGQIIETVSGKSFKHYIENEIFAPLEMHNSVVELPQSKYGKSHAIGYSAMNREGNRQAANFYQTRAMQGAAGVSSNALDLAKFIRWQFDLSTGKDNRLLSAETLAKMYQNNYAPAVSTRGLVTKYIKMKQAKMGYAWWYLSWLYLVS